MILARFNRLDGMGFVHVLVNEGVDPVHKFAQNLYTSPKESFPGQQASMHWEYVRSWFVPENFGSTTQDAMKACGIKD